MFPYFAGEGTGYGELRLDANQAACRGRSKSFAPSHTHAVPNVMQSRHY